MRLVPHRGVGDGLEGAKEGARGTAYHSTSLIKGHLPSTRVYGD
jgi:hypothetical protein